MHRLLSKFSYHIHLRLYFSLQTLTVKWRGGARSQRAGAVALASPKRTLITAGNENPFWLSRNLFSDLPLSSTQSQLHRLFPHVPASPTSDEEETLSYYKINTVNVRIYQRLISSTYSDTQTLKLKVFCFDFIFSKYLRGTFFCLFFIKYMDYMTCGEQLIKLTDLTTC